MKSIEIISILALISISCPVAPSLADDGNINHRLKATFDKAKAHGLETGMTAAQVEGIVGKPDNRDWNVGFVFGKDTIRVWMCVQKKSHQFASWRDFLANDREFGLGYFFLLVNDRLESPVPSLTSKEAVVLHNLIDGKVKNPPKPFHGRGTD